jgi:hypothetical protein
MESKTGRRPINPHLLSRIKGAERKAALKRSLDSGRPEDIADFLAKWR